MSSKADIGGGMGEMDFSMVDNGIMELPCSKPATFAFVEEPTLDVTALEDKLDGYDFGMFTPNYDEREDGQFYCHVEIVTDHYKKVKSKIWNDSVRIYPREDMPDTYEFTRIVHAIEDAFGAELEHAPVEEDDE